MAFLNRFRQEKQEHPKDEQQQKPLANVSGKRCKPSSEEQQDSQKMTSDTPEGFSLFSGMTISMINNQSEEQRSDEVNVSSSPLSTGLSTNVQELHDILSNQVISCKPVLMQEIKCYGSNPDPAREKINALSLVKDTDAVNVAEVSPVNDQEVDSQVASFRKFGPNKKKKKAFFRPGYANIADVAATCIQKNVKESITDIPPNKTVAPCSEARGQASDVTEVDICEEGQASKLSQGLNSDATDGLVSETSNSITLTVEGVTMVSPDYKRTVPLYTIGTPSSSEENFNENNLEVPHSKAMKEDSVVESKMKENESAYDDHLFLGVLSDQGEPQNGQLDISLMEAVNDLRSRKEILDLKEIDSERTSDWPDNDVSQSLPSESKPCNAIIQEFTTENQQLEAYSEKMEPENLLTQHMDKEIDSLSVSIDESILSQRTKDEFETLDIVLSNQETKYDAVLLGVEDQLALVEQHLHEKLESVSGEELLVKLEKAVITQFSNYHERQLEKEELLKHLQKDELHALANDNYDVAEDVNSKINKLKLEVKEMRNLFPREDSEVKQLLTLTCDVNQRRIGLYEEAQLALVKIKEKKSFSLTKEQQEKEHRISKGKTWISSESLRIERDIGHLKLDKEHLEKDQAQLDGEISEKTCDFVARRDDLIHQRQKIQEEIYSLENHLKLLKDREYNHTFAIEKEIEKIDRVKKTYEPQQKLLELRRTDIEQAEKGLEKDQHKLQVAEDELKKWVRDFLQTEQRFTQFLENISNVAESCDKSINALKEDCTDIDEYLCAGHLAVTDQVLSRLQDALSESDTRVKSLSARVLHTDRAIHILTKRLDEIEAQIADILEAKENSKAERNFKEAKRLKEESDLLHTEGVANQKKLETLKQQLIQESSSLDEAQSENTKLGEVLRKKECQADTNRIQSANGILASLSRFKDRFTKNKVLKILLEAEVTICQNLIDDLCKKHGISSKQAYEENSKKERSEVKENDEYCQRENEDTPDRTPKIFQEMADQLDVLEGQLEAVIEIEDYDKADRINQEIIKVKKELDNYRAQSRCLDEKTSI